MTFLLAWGEDRKVERLRAPDGGLDTLLPRAGKAGEAERGWQAKHYPGPRIHWGKCEESLDRAVELWKVTNVTFTFPRDLNRDERRAFTEKLERRHDGVTVDFMSGSEIKARLAFDEAGERIARRFFGQHDPVEVMERALRAGGELSTGEHAVDREFAIDEFVQGEDPHYAWVVHKAPREKAEPPPTSGAVMRLLFSKGGFRMYADAVPRSKTVAEQYGPKATVVTDDSPAGQEAQRLMEDLFAGGLVQLREGAKLALEHLPKPFGDLITEPLEGDLTVKAVPVTDTWYARLEVDSDLGQGSIDLDLEPADPSAEWVSRWDGSKSGLVLDVRTRWLVNAGRGETALSVGYQSKAAPSAERLEALRVMVALSGNGTMRLLDRTGSRLTLEQGITARPVDPEVKELLGLVDALVWIERYSGQPAPEIPDEIQLSELDGLRGVAATLRAGGQLARMRSAKLIGSHKMVEEIRRSGSDIRVEERAFVEVFGHEVEIGKRVMNLPLMQIQLVTRLGSKKDDPWEVTLVPVNAHEIEVWMEFQPLTGTANKEPPANQAA